MSTTGPFTVTQLENSGPCDYCATGGDAALGPCDCIRVVHREAFATLDGARAIIAALAASHWNGVTVAQRDAALSPYNDGGTIGPLPNGDVIEVEATTYERLYDDLSADGQASTLAPTDWRAAALAAWNAEHGIGIGEERA